MATGIARRQFMQQLREGQAVEVPWEDPQRSILAAVVYQVLQYSTGANSSTTTAVLAAGKCPQEAAQQKIIGVYTRNPIKISTALPVFLNMSSSDCLTYPTEYATTTEYRCLTCYVSRSRGRCVVWCVASCCSSVLVR